MRKLIKPLLIWAAIIALALGMYYLFAEPLGNISHNSPDFVTNDTFIGKNPIAVAGTLVILFAIVIFFIYSPPQSEWLQHIDKETLARRSAFPLLILAGCGTYVICTNLLIAIIAITLTTLYLLIDLIKDERMPLLYLWLFIASSVTIVALIGFIFDIPQIKEIISLYRPS